jgi:copper chaperone CopZ
VDFKDKDATVAFDEKVISAQEVARAMSTTPHMMGRNMQYGGILLLSVRGVKEEATAKKATDALSKVEGVSKVTLYPKQEAVGIEFSGKGKVTSKQLIEALEKAGLKGARYVTASGPGGQARNAANASMPEGAGMRMENGALGASGGMVHRMSCRCGGCGGCR